MKFDEPNLTLRFLTSKTVATGGWLENHNELRSRSRRRWVRLPRVGDVVEHSFSTPTDEGLTSSTTTYRRAPDGVLKTHEWAARDCDGPGYGGYKQFVFATQLREVRLLKPYSWLGKNFEPEYSGGVIPNWGGFTEEWYRDVYAEMMGY